MRIKRNMIAITVILISLLALLYPWMSNYVFEHRANSLVQTYSDWVSVMEDEEKEKIRSMAKAYNDTLCHGVISLQDPFGITGSNNLSLIEAVKEFAAFFDWGEEGVIGSINIPTIEVNLPIYASSSYPNALTRGVAVVDLTSLPIGGVGTHSVISGHTGLNQAKLFTDLINLEEGDYFFISVLGETMAYQVDAIYVVLPSDTSLLAIDPEEDYVTLLTCTPYGTNTHRLLVRGVRTEYVTGMENTMTSQNVTSQWHQEYRRALLCGVGIAFLLVVLVCLGRKIHGEGKKKNAKKKG